MMVEQRIRLKNHVLERINTSSACICKDLIKFAIHWSGFI